jgi:putative two-component system response regulator
MDVMMPVMDGIEATRRSADPTTRLIPVVVVTALTDAKARQAAIEAGADDFLSKPIDALELQIRVKALLAVKRIYDELEAARRKAEEQDRLKTEFLASVSHELRTPLTAIASAAKILVKHGAEKKETLTRFAPMLVEQ